MSRIEKYRESIVAFIFSNKITNKFDKDEIIIFEKFLKHNELLKQIFILTITYNLNTTKKNIQLYYVISFITFIEFILWYNQYQMKYENNKMIEKVNLIIKEILDHYLDKYINDKTRIIIDKILTIPPFNKHTNNVKYSTEYIFNDKELKNKYDRLELINKNEFIIFSEYVNEKISKIGMEICLKIIKYEGMKLLLNMSKIFGMINKIGNDFKNFENDIKNSNEICYNYLVNVVIQKTYTIYLEKKTEFYKIYIEDGNKNLLLTEIINKIDDDIENFINKTHISLDSTIIEKNRED